VAVVFLVDAAPPAPALLGALGLRQLRLASARWLKEQVLAGLRGLDETEVAAIGRLFAQAVLMPRLRDAGLRELAACRAGGSEIVLITGAFDFLVLPVVVAQDIRQWRATRLEFVRGYCTGRILGPELAGAEKRAQVCDLFAGQQIDWAESCAYGDEPADLSLLAMVGRPHFVRSAGRLPAALPPDCTVVDWGS
jgi:phosphoserine phosphatase